MVKRGVRDSLVMRVLEELFGERVETVLEEIIKSKENLVQAIIDGGYNVREEDIVRVLSKHFMCSYELKVEEEGEFILDAGDGSIMSSKGIRYHYYPVDKGVVLIPYSEYRRLYSKIASGRREIGGDEFDPVAYFDRLVIESLGKGINDILIDGVGAIYKIYVKALGGGKEEVAILERSIGERLIRSLKARASKYSDVKVNVSDRAQSGRIRLDEYGIEVRIEFLPGADGESASVRVYNVAGYFNKRLEELGYSEEFVELTKRIAKRKNGLILVGGATGQGKSTLIKSMVLEADPFVKVVRLVEDPVEMLVKGATQLQTKEGEDGFSFSDAVRSFMRAVPDIIVIGEVRDGATAVAVLDASLSGHLVYTTIHANDCVGNLERFVLKVTESRLMGRDEVLQSLASSLLLTVNQILVKVNVDGKKRLMPIVEYLEPGIEERKLIRHGEFEELRKYVKGKLNEQVRELYKKGYITEEQFISYTGVEV